MEKIILFHGSTKEIRRPILGIGNRHNDYGLAFYCTQDIYAAKEWANKFSTNGIVNKYQFDMRGLDVLDLTDKTKYSVLNWIAILIHNRNIEPIFYETHQRAIEYLLNRYYIDTTRYDVVIGYRADDAYFNFPLYFLSNQITLEKLEEVYRLGFLGTQIAIISEKAFNKLTFEKSIEVEPIYKDKYELRMNIARNRFSEIIVSEQHSNGTRLIDLVKKESL